MEGKIRLAVFGQKRLSREGGIEIVVKELCTRMAQNSRVIRSRCVLRVGVKRTLNKHPLGGWVFRMGESSFLTKLLVKL